MARGRRTEYDPRRRVGREDWLRGLTMIDAVGNNAVRDLAAPDGQPGGGMHGTPMLVPDPNILGADDTDIEVVQRGLGPAAPAPGHWTDEGWNSKDLGTITLDEWKERERRNEGRGQ